VVILARLTHANIVPLLGVTVNPPQLISKWMAVGSCRGTSKNIPVQTYLDSWVSFPLCLSHLHSRYQFSDVAAGLEYLHSCNVFHGDLKGVRRYNIRLAKRPCGRLWPCTRRRFWPLCCPSKHGFHAGHLSAWLLLAMDRARSTERRVAHQGNECFLFRDAHG